MRLTFWNYLSEKNDSWLWLKLPRIVWIVLAVLKGLSNGLSAGELSLIDGIFWGLMALVLCGLGFWKRKAIEKREANKAKAKT